MRARWRAASAQPVTPGTVGKNGKVRRVKSWKSPEMIDDIRDEPPLRRSQAAQGGHRQGHHKRKVSKRKAYTHRCVHRGRCERSTVKLRPTSRLLGRTMSQVLLATAGASHARPKPRRPAPPRPFSAHSHNRKPRPIAQGMTTRSASGRRLPATARELCSTRTRRCARPQRDAWPCECRRGATSQYSRPAF